MPVIKGVSAANTARDAVVLDLADIAQQAAAIRHAAEREAARIIEAAKGERERLIADASEVGRATGHAEGLAEGREAGRAEGRAEAIGQQSEALGALQAAWSAALEEFVAQRDHLVVGCKRDVLQIATSIAERITHRAIEMSPDALPVVLDQIESALHIVAKPTRAVVAVHPEDAESARESLPALTKRIDGIEHAEIVEDGSLSRGSCVVRTDRGGGVDASVETQLRRIAELIVPVRSSETEQEDRTVQADDDGTPHARGDIAA